MYLQNLRKPIRLIVTIPLFAVLLVLSIVGPVGIANAASVTPSWQLLGTNLANTCSGGLSTSVYVNNPSPASENGTWVVAGIGQVGLTSDHNFQGVGTYGFNPAQTMLFTVPAHTLETLTVTTYKGGNLNGGVSYVSSITWDCTTGKIITGGPVSSLYNFMDGRCNQEPWQSFAVYPDGKGGWIFYALYQGVGTYAMHVTKAFLDANPNTGVNHIIAQSDGVQLWRLAGGLLQVHRIGMDGKDYSFNLDHCDGAAAPNFPPPVPNTY